MEKVFYINVKLFIVIYVMVNDVNAVNDDIYLKISKCCDPWLLTSIPNLDGK